MHEAEKKTIQTIFFFRAVESAKRRASFEINIAPDSILSNERQLRQRVRKNYTIDNTQPQGKSPASSVGNKKVWCPVCNQGFTRKYNLKVNICNMVHGSYGATWKC